MFTTVMGEIDIEEVVDNAMPNGFRVHRSPRLENIDL